jgi:hypothetical protein
MSLGDTQGIAPVQKSEFAFDGVAPPLNLPSADNADHFQPSGKLKGESSAAIVDARELPE